MLQRADGQEKEEKRGKIVQNIGYIINYFLTNRTLYIYKHCKKSIYKLFSYNKLSRSRKGKLRIGCYEDLKEHAVSNWVQIV